MLKPLVLNRIWSLICCIMSWMASPPLVLCMGDGSFLMKGPMDGLVDSV